ncbi:MAG: TerB N-terminal domain-containing protein [Candidatus Paceibacterota bacterium]
MGIFNFFRKKKKDIKSNSLNTGIVIPSKSITKLSFEEFTIHGDLLGLLWIADGKYKNYKESSSNKTSVNINGIQISFSYLNKEEPSLIYTTQSISKPRDLDKVQRPPYFPTYSSLTPEQKWVYLKLLANPYNNSVDVGYVFILYYGLERQLLEGNFEKAFDTILKLRDVHTNKSFQSYTANALILSCLIHQRPKYVLKFIQSLDKEHELSFSDDLFLLCYFNFDIPPSANNLMRMAKTFEFTNLNYIKKYPEVFQNCLEDTLSLRSKNNDLKLSSYFKNSDLGNVKTKEIRLFANMSISDESVLIPIISENFKLKKDVYIMLETAHNNTKSILAENRKKGKPNQPKISPKKEKAVITFDYEQEKALLHQLAQSKRDLVKRHFAYLALQKFYYKYRSLSDEYLNKCIDFCLLDLNSLDDMVNAYKSQELKALKNISSLYDSDYVKKETLRIREEGFIGNIPAFKRLAIIYEKQGKILDAIEICDRAIEYGQSITEFIDRKDKLEQKIRK